MYAFVRVRVSVCVCARARDARRRQDDSNHTHSEGRGAPPPPCRSHPGEVRGSRGCASGPPEAQPLAGAPRRRRAERGRRRRVPRLAMRRASSRAARGLEGALEREEARGGSIRGGFWKVWNSEVLVGGP